ncbi:MAG: A24 family peptidase [Pseudomonadota bacterium]
MLEKLPGSLRAHAPASGLGIIVLLLMFVGLSLWFGVAAPVWVIAATGVLVAWAIWIDIETCRLPDTLTLPLFIVAMANGALGGEAAVISAVFGAVLGYCVMRLAGLYMDWRLRLRFMMLGDAKFMAGLGGLIGWEGLPALLLVGSLSGLVEGVVRKIVGRVRTDAGVVAFGPHLALGFVTVWLVGTDWLLSISARVFGAVG